MKKVIKSTKSTNNPTLTVDFTNPSNIGNPRFAFIEAKMEQNVSFTENDLDAILYYMTSYVINEMFENCNSVVSKDGLIFKCTAFELKPEVKKPWYKRFWNWITRTK